MKALINYDGVVKNIMPTLFRNDSGFKIVFNIRNEDDTNVDLTGATIRFKMKKIDEITTKVNSLCNIDDAVMGLCSYTFALNDLDSVGVFDVELEIVFSGTIIRTIKMGRVSVLEDLI